MAKAGQIKRRQGIQKLGRRVKTMHNLPLCFFINCISKSNSFILEGDFALSKNMNFVQLFTTIHWVKQPLPAELIFLM